MLIPCASKVLTKLSGNGFDVENRPFPPQNTIPARTILEAESFLGGASKIKERMPCSVASSLTESAHRPVWLTASKSIFIITTQNLIFDDLNQAVLA